MIEPNIRGGEGRCGVDSRLGFTLIELLVVIAIIATLAGLLLGAIRKTPEQGKKVACRQMISQLDTAWNYYLTENQGFPSETLTEMDTNSIDYIKGYVDFTLEEQGTNSATSGLRDPWGELLSIRLDTDLDGEVTTPHGQVDKYVAIWSKGPDGVEDTRDDIKSWDK